MSEDIQTTNDLGDPRRLCGVAEAAALLSESLGIRISVPTVRSWARRGVRGVRLPIVRVAGHVFVRPADVQTFLEAAAAAAARGRGMRDGIDAVADAAAAGAEVARG